MTAVQNKVTFKYLIANSSDHKLRMVVNTVGCQRIAPFEEYPLRDHPSGYFFSPENGRVLHEYQLLYITEGSGVLQYGRTQQSRRNISVKKGSIILLQPGVWHSYRPLKETGWTEYYIGFTGSLFSSTISVMEVFDEQNPVHEIGFSNELITLYMRAIEVATSTNAAIQPLMSGVVMHILGLVNMLVRGKELSTSSVEQMIERAKIYMDEHIEEEVDLEVLASMVNSSYSWFRKTFKDYTGHSPAKYFQLLKLRRAQQMLSETQMSIKEIAYALGYKSVEHFFSVFKKNTGSTPTAYRNYGRE